jgi:hypothetical protein
MAGWTLDTYTPMHVGILKEAIPAQRKLFQAMDEQINSGNYWPCHNNPYFYMDYDGYGFETEEGHGVIRKITEDEAEMLCADCPLLKQCYDFAVANKEQEGIWGGIDFGADDSTLF